MGKVSREQALHNGLDALEGAVTRAVENNLPILPDDERRNLWMALRNRPVERRAYLQRLAVQHGDQRSIEELDQAFVSSSREEFD